MKYGGDPEVPPCVIVTLVGVQIADSGRVHSQNDYYVIFLIMSGSVKLLRYLNKIAKQQ